MLNFGERLITTKDFQLILFGNERIEISKSAKNKVLENYRFLQSFYKDKIIYGINTGLGPMAQYLIDDADRIKLQYNAIRSHAAGCGESVDQCYVRHDGVAVSDREALLERRDP